jgi:hypothetical protein
MRKPYMPTPYEFVLLATLILFVPFFIITIPLRLLRQRITGQPWNEVRPGQF